jgi:transcription antitermination factor NusG
MSEGNNNWYALYTKPRWEKKVYEYMVRQGLDAYCPLNRVRKKWSDRIKWVEEPLFKSYVFVHIPEKDQILARRVNGVVNFVYWLGKPAVIKDYEIETIRKFLDDHDEVSVEPLALEKDALITIRQGALMNQEGKVMKVYKNKVQVAIQSIGYRLVAVVKRSNVVRPEK